ncbi:MAG: TVP38/TMEM64 family protein [Acidobacteria bacterium]|nr:TVP38/TMEM64 family protein [Acidobacteriota bacterium]
MTRRTWIRSILVAAGAAAVVLAITLLPVGEWMRWLVAWIRDAGAVGVVVYAAAYIAATVLLLPGSILGLGAGFAYGPLGGTLLVSPVSVTAATIAFLLGRTVARGWIAERVSRDPRFAAIDAAIEREGLKIVLLLRLSPVFPFNVLNYALGLTRVRLSHYVVGSFVGMLPGTFLYVYLGSLVTTTASLGATGETAGTAQQVVYWGGLAATVLATIFIMRLARRALRAALTHSSPPA